MPRPLPPSKPIKHLFFYKFFLCLVYDDDSWWLYDTPDEEFGGCVGLKGGKEEAKIVASRPSKNMEVWADRQNS
jgi:hypothetical protein